MGSEIERAGLECPQWWSEPTPLVGAYAALAFFRALVVRCLERSERPRGNGPGRLRTRTA